MPSDAGKILQQPLQWRYGNRNYLLGPCDVEMELYFQAIHEGWSRNRLESRKRFMSIDMYLTDVSEFQESVDENRFAFGGKISMRWLLCPVGFLEYVILKMQLGQTKFGGDPPDRDFMAKLQRDNDPAWIALEKMVLRNDFPNLILDGEESASAVQAQPKSEEAAPASAS
jgi:hypothetical protein